MLTRFANRRLSPVSLAFWLVPPALAMMLYGSTGTLPFFWDDVANFQHLFGKNIGQVWIDSTGFPYYRPFTFTVWFAVQKLFGATNPAPFHWLNILTLAVNGWAVGALAATLNRTSNYAPLLAAVFMVIFPFAALVVPLVASLFHLHVTLLTTSACVCLLHFHSHRMPIFAVLAIALATLAPFAHESGIASGALMGVCWLALLTNENKMGQVWARVKEAKATLATIGATCLTNALYYPVWASIPKAQPGSSLGWVGWESTTQSAVFFLEGLTFPIQFLARSIMSFGVADLWAVMGLGAVALVTASLALTHKHWLAFALVYCYLAAAPAIGALPFSYIIVSPRLMVFTAPAAAVLWAFSVEQAARRAMHRTGGTVLAAMLAIAISVVPVYHIVREVRLHHHALDHLWDVIRFAQTHPDKRLLMVNPVNWIAPVQATYALGHEGVEVMPDYLNMQLIVWAHTQELYNFEQATFALIFPPLTDIYFSTGGTPLDWETMADRVRQSGRVALVRYTDERLIFQDLGAVTRADGSAVVSFEERIWLTDYAVTLQNGWLVAQMSWRVNSASGEDIYANALDCAGSVLGLSGGASMGGIYPIWLWRAGEQINEVRHIPLDALSPDGCYLIEVGLFNPHTGARTMAYDPAGERLANDSLYIPFNAP